MPFAASRPSARGSAAASPYRSRQMTGGSSRYAAKRGMRDLGCNDARFTRAGPVVQLCGSREN